VVPQLSLSWTYNTGTDLLDRQDEDTGEGFPGGWLRAGSLTIRCDEYFHRARVAESLESGGRIVDAGDLGSQIGDL
jgi:hypothetical protein